MDHTQELSNENGQFCLLQNVEDPRVIETLIPWHTRNRSVGKLCQGSRLNLEDVVRHVWLRHFAGPSEYAIWSTYTCKSRSLW